MAISPTIQRQHRLFWLLLPLVFLLTRSALPDLHAQGQESSDPARFKQWHQRPATFDYRDALEHWGQLPHDQVRTQVPTDAAWQPVLEPITSEARQLTGRLSSLRMAADPSNPGEDTIWVGASSGGLWARDPVTDRWRRVSAGLNASPSVGDFLVLPTGTIVLATGDPWRYAGSGIFLSNDNGANWVGATMPETPSSFYRLNMDRTNPARIFAVSPVGLWRSDDGGGNWSALLSGHFTEIVQDPHDDSHWYAGGFDVGVMISHDGGSSFTESNGNPPVITAPIGRVSISPSPAQPGLLFALVADFAQTRGIFRSLDGGLSWSELNPGFDVSWGQAFHTNAIAAHPTDADLLMVAQGGAKISRNARAGSVVWEDLQDTGHADSTRLMWTGANELMVTNDGGIFHFNVDTLEADGALNEGLGVLQVFATGAITVDPNVPERGWLGLQDNGVVSVALGEPNMVQMGWGGDGGWVTAARYALDRIAAAVGLPFERYLSLNSGASFSHIGCVPGDAPGNPPVAFDPLPGLGNTPRLYATAAGNGQVDARLFRIDFSQSCAFSVSSFQIPDSLEFSNSFISVADDPGRLVAYLSPGPDDSDTDLARARSPIGLRNGPLIIERLPPPVARAGRFSAAAGRPNELFWWPYQGTPELWRNTTQGDAGSWQDLTGNLSDFGPGLRIQRAESHPRVDSELYLATNLGVLVSYDDGERWRPFGAGLPAVLDAVDLKLAPHDADPQSSLRLWLASYGHGLWERSIADGVLWADDFEP